jgi:hypothetical protein
MSDKPILIPQETRALRAAVGFLTAGEADGHTQQEVEAAESAFSKLSGVPPQSVWIPFSRMELDMLWMAITNGAEGVLQPSSGVRQDQRQAFRNAANRIADAGDFGPRF